MELTEAIIRTLAYFDLFDRPLTKEELCQYLWRSDEQEECLAVLRALAEGGGNGRIRERDGYFFLAGREEIVAAHHKRIWLVERRMKTARRAAAILRLVPFLRSVFVCNTVAMKAPKQTSDVDVFILVAPGRLYTARVFITILTALLGVRRGKRHVAGRVCLSFYATTDALDLSSIALPGEDIYLAYWLLQLLPLYDKEHFWHVIQQENLWVREFVPAGFVDTHLIPRWRVDDGRIVCALREFGERILSGHVGDKVEQFTRRVQQEKMRRNKRSLQNRPDSRVIISDKMLKFHENDRRAAYRRKWKERAARFLD